jgi:DNA polymerase-3 subunit beta
LLSHSYYMHFICTQENLLKGLTTVAPLAGRNTQLPVLQNVLLEIREGTLHLTCTDLEVGAHTVIGGKAEKEGNCVVAARRLLEYVQQLPSVNPLTLTKKKELLRVVTEGITAQFTVMTADEFPLLPTSSQQAQLTIDGKKFCEALARTLFSAARDDSRPEIHSVFISSDGTNISIAATDSFRLAEEMFALDTPGEFSILLPVAAAQEVVRLFAAAPTLEILHEENYVNFHGEGTDLSSRLVDGKYPDYKKLLPHSYKTKIVVSRSEFIRALKILSVFLPRTSRRVHIHAQPTQHLLVMYVEGGEAGQGRVELPIEGEGEDIDILFNIHYLLEGAQHVPSENLELHFNGTGDPLIFYPAGEASSRYLYMVMPVMSA